MPYVLRDASVDTILEVASEFLMKRGPVHETMRRLAARLHDEQIPYALIGGMALGLHGYLRVTADVDVLTTPEGLQAIHERLVGRGYVPSFPGARKSLRDTSTGVIVEFITTGEYPGDGKEKPVRFPDPADFAIDREGIEVLALPKLIELKLASGMTASHRYLRDLGDVQWMIENLELPRDLANELDPFVRGEYLRLWDLYEASKSSK